jgi:MraZ protein
MLTRKTQYAWMAMGGLICLFGLVLACKLRDGNKAIAQADKPSLAKEDKEPPLSPPPAAKELPPPLGVSLSTTPEMVLPPTIDTKSPPIKKKEQGELKKEVKLPKLDTPPMPEHVPAVPPLDPPPSMPEVKSPPPAAPSGILPVSFSPDPLPAPSAPSEKSKPKNEDKGIPPFTSSMGTPPPPSKAPAPVPSSPLDAPPPALPSPAKSPEMKSANPPKPTNALRSVADEKPVWNHPREPNVTPTGFAHPIPAAPSTSHADPEIKSQPGEPPLAPAPGPVQIYHVRGSETLQDIARRTLGSPERWGDIHKLNPALKADTPLHAGMTVRLPADACVQADDTEPVKPLPALRPKPTPPKAKVLPLTGTYQCSLDEKSQLTLPRALRDQLDSDDTVLLSPGPDKCLWLTNSAHLERLGERLDQSQAHEADVRVFKRLYFAQTEKLTVNSDGRVSIPERLAQFAGLHQELVLVGIDDHFELWDAARWRQYTQQKSAAAGRATTMADAE